MGGPPWRGDKWRGWRRPGGLRARHRHGFLYPHRCGGPPAVVGALRARGFEEPRGHGARGFGQHRHQRARPRAPRARASHRHVQRNCRCLSIIIIIILHNIQWEALTTPPRYRGEGVPSAVRNRHREQHPSHAAQGHRRCRAPVPHADRVHPERLRSEDRCELRSGFGPVSVVRRVLARPARQGVDRRTARREAEDDEGDDLSAYQQTEGDGPPRRGERTGARHGPERLPHPIRESLEGMEFRRIKHRDRDRELSQDGRPFGEARGAAEVTELAEDIVSLTKGSRYRIESMETRERTKVTKGIFRGYATIGTDDAIVVELDESHQELKGKMRLIPLHVVLPVSEVREILALSAGLGQLLFFGGLVAALWRANLAAGVSNAGIRGLAFGVAGVGILGVFEFALFLDWLGAAFNPMAVFARSPVLDTGVIAGTALAFAGLASLVVGFAQSTDLFGRRERVVSQRAAQREETG